MQAQSLALPGHRDITHTTTVSCTAAIIGRTRRSHKPVLGPCRLCASQQTRPCSLTPEHCTEYHQRSPLSEDTPHAPSYCIPSLPAACMLYWVATAHIVKQLPSTTALSNPPTTHHNGCSAICAAAEGAMVVFWTTTTPFPAQTYLHPLLKCVSNGAPNHNLHHARKY